MDTVKLFNKLCQTENITYPRKSVAQTMVVIRFRNISGFAAAIKEVSAVGTRIQVLLKKGAYTQSGQ
jgi:hypothetical protein